MVELNESQSIVPNPTNTEYEIIGDGSFFDKSACDISEGGGSEGVVYQRRGYAV